MQDLARRNLVVMHASDVAGKQQLLGLATGAYRNLHHRRPENMSGAHEAKRKLLAKLFDLAEVDRTEQRHTLLRLFHGVERQRRMMFRRLGLVVELGVFFLQMPGVGKQDAAQIDGCGGRIDRSVKTLLHQTRNPAGVIEMRVRKNDGIDGISRHRQILPVALAPFFLTLKQTAIDQHLQAACSHRRQRESGASIR